MSDIENTSVDEQICAAHIDARRYSHLAASLVDQATVAAGLPAAEANKLGCFAQELANSIVVNAFEPDGPAMIEVSVTRRPGGIEVTITDKGAPSYLTRVDSQPQQLGELIRFGFADELSFESRGMEGNSAKVFKQLPYPDVREDSDLIDSPESVVAEDETPEIVVRAMQPEDALEVSRLFHRCYGYSAYYLERMYSPELVAEYVAAGRHRGTVAFVGDKCVGHVASKVMTPDAVMSEVGLLVVDPAYRKFKVAAQLSFTHAIRMVEDGFIGQIARAVTIHTASQKISLKFGGHEIGLMLAADQPSIEFKDFDAPTDQRRSFVFFYNGVGKEPHRLVHVPSSYRDICSEIYSNANLPRELGDIVTRAPADTAETTRLDLQLDHPAKLATIRVVEYGNDFLAALQKQVNELCVQRFDVVWLELSLMNPKTAFFGSGLQQLGFFFGAVLPEWDSGDVLVLQFLNNQELDPDLITLASDFGQHLRDFTMNDWKTATQNVDTTRRSRAHLARIYEALK